MILATAFLMIALIQDQHKTLYVSSPDLLTNLDGVLRSISMPDVDTVIVPIEVEASIRGTDKATSLHLTDRFIKVISSANRAGKVVDFLLPLSRTQDWMESLVPDSGYEQSSFTAYAPKLDKRFLNLAGMKDVIEAERDLIAKSPVAARTCYFDCRAPIWPLFFDSLLSRQSAIRAIGVDPVDLAELDITAFASKFAALPLENQQHYLLLASFYHEKRLQGIENLISSTMHNRSVGYTVSELHFLLSPELRLREASDFLFSKQASQFERVLILPPQTPVDRAAFTSAFEAFDKQCISPNLKYCWVQQNDNPEDSIRALDSHPRLLPKLRFGYSVGTK